MVKKWNQATNHEVTAYQLAMKLLTSLSLFPPQLQIHTMSKQQPITDAAT